MLRMIFRICKLSRDVQDLKDQRVTVAGLGHFGGQIACRAAGLVEQGAKVIVTDRAPAEKLADSIAQLDGLPIEFRLGEHRALDFTDADLVLCASPAIPFGNEFSLPSARAAGVPITTEIRLFIERCPATIIGVTGTKGKSTTTALLGEMLKDAICHLGRRKYRRFPFAGAWQDRQDTSGRARAVELHARASGGDAMVAARGGGDDDRRRPSRMARRGSVLHQREGQHCSLPAFCTDDVAVLNEENAEAMSALARMTAGRVVAFGIDGRRRPFELPLPGRVHNQAQRPGAAYAAADAAGD